MISSNYFKSMLTVGVLSAFTLSFSACNSGSKETASQNEQSATPGERDQAQNTAQAEVMEVADYSAVDDAFKTQITGIYHQYLSLKDGLFADNLSAVQKAAQGIGEQVSKVNTSTLSAEQKGFFDKHAAMVKQHVQAIASAGSVEQQRAELDMLSASTFALVKAFGANDETAFYQYCPMANDNKGAYWISEQEKIQNPYMGKKMPTCGENKERLASN